MGRLATGSGRGSGERPPVFPDDPGGWSGLVKNAGRLVPEAIEAFPKMAASLGRDTGQGVQTILTAPAVGAARLAGMSDGDLRRRANWIRDVPGLGMLGVDEALREYGTQESGSLWQQANRRAHRHLPFLSDVGTSMRGSGERAVETVASFAPGGLSPSDTQYGQAWRDGEFLSLALEDIGNASLAGGLLGASLGRGAKLAGGRAVPRYLPDETGLATRSNRGRLGQATTGADKVATFADQMNRVAMLGDDIADAPLTVWRAGPRAVGRQMMKSGNPRRAALGESLYSRGAIRTGATAAANRAPVLRAPYAFGERLGLVGHGRGVSNLDNAGTNQQNIRNKRMVEQGLAEIGQKMTDAEYGALLLDRSAIGRQMFPNAEAANAWLSIDDAAKRRFTDAYRERFGQNFTDEAFDTYARHVSGDAPFDAEVWDEAGRLFDENVAGTMAGDYLSNYGGQQDLTPDQMVTRQENVYGEGPLSVVQQRVDRLGGLTERADTQARTQATRLSRAEAEVSNVSGKTFDQIRTDMAEVKRARARAESSKRRFEELEQRYTEALEDLDLNPQSAPSRYRPMLRASKFLRDAMENAEKEYGPTVAAYVSEASAGSLETLMEVVEQGVDPTFLPGGVIETRIGDLTDAGDMDIGPLVDLIGEEQMARVRAEMEEGSTRKISEGEVAGRALRAVREAADAGDDAAMATARQVDDWMRANDYGRLHMGGGNLWSTVETAPGAGGSGQLKNESGTPTSRRQAESYQAERGQIPTTVIGMVEVVMRRNKVNAENWLARQVADQLGTKARVGGSGEAVVKGMAEWGRRNHGTEYVPWDPTSSTYDVLPASQVTADTVFLPKNVMDSLQSRWGREGTIENAIANVYDRATNTWKGGVLALSPQWHIGNVGGNVLLGSLIGEVSPAYLKANWGRIKRMADMAENDPMRLAEEFGPEVLDMFTPHPDRNAMRAARGLEAGTAGNPNMVGQQVGKVRGALSAGVQWSYKFNELIDNIHKSATYLKNLDDLEKAGGTVTDAMRARAVELALRSAPDFRQSWAEYRVIRRLQPFYPWLRHMTKVAWELGRDHPARVAWTVALGSQFSDESTADIPWLQSAYGFGGGLINVGSLNPLSGILPVEMFHEATEGGSGVSPLARSINPLLKLGVGFFTGYNVDELRPYDGPPGSGRVDYLGRPTASPLALDPSTLLYQAGGLTPQTRVLREAFGPDSTISRYDTGDPMLRATRVPGSNRYVYSPYERSGGGLRPAILSAAGLRLPGQIIGEDFPVLGPAIGLPPMDVDVDAMRRQRDDRLAERADERDRYSRARLSANV